jgi:putative hydrolase
MQAVMSLIEGHSNYVMNRIGAQQIPHFGELQRRIEARRQQRPTLDNLIMHATGMHIKMAQYSTGEAFVNAIAAHGGDDLVVQLWQSAAQIPTAAELMHPEQWVRRV